MTTNDAMAELTAAAYKSAVSVIEQRERELSKGGQRSGVGLEVMKDSPSIKLLLSSAAEELGSDGAQRCGLHRLTAVELYHLAFAAGAVFDRMKDEGRKEPRINLTPEEAAKLPRPKLEDSKWDENLFVSRLESWFAGRQQTATQSLSDSKKLHPNSGRSVQLSTAQMVVMWYGVILAAGVLIGAAGASGAVLGIAATCLALIYTVGERPRANRGLVAAWVVGLPIGLAGLIFWELGRERRADIRAELARPRPLGEYEWMTTCWDYQAGKLSPQLVARINAEIAAGTIIAPADFQLRGVAAPAAPGVLEALAEKSKVARDLNPTFTGLLPEEKAELEALKAEKERLAPSVATPR